MNVLIVDDEAILRENILAILKHSRLRISEFFCAKNAFEAIDIIDKKHPEIILTDIRMPSKSGLDIAEYVSDRVPQTQVILITGYSDFQYAQEAIRSKVFDYLLKPVDAEELQTVVDKACSKIEQERKHTSLYSVFQKHFSDNIQAIRKQYIESLLFKEGVTENSDNYKDIYRLNFKRYRLVSVKCAVTIGGNQLESEYYCTYFTEKYIFEHYQDTVTCVFGNLVLFLWEVTNEDLFNDNDILLRFLSNLLSYCKGNFLGTISAGISQTSSTLDNIQNLRHQVSECLEYLNDNKKQGFIFYEDIMEADPSRWKSESEVQHLVSAVRSGNSELAAKLFGEITDGLSGKTDEYILTVYLLIISNISFLLHEMNVDSAKLFSMADSILPMMNQKNILSCTTTMYKWIEKSCTFISQEFQLRTNSIVNKTIEFINIYFSSSIGLAEASRYVNRNSSYVSRLIREQTGKNFTQLLTEKRISEAKKLLGESDLKISEISEKVGYANERYFTRVFKANLNISPNDYRSFTKTFS